MNDSPRVCWISISSAGLRLRKSLGQLSQQIGIDGDAFAFHLGQNRRQRRSSVS